MPRLLLKGANLTPRARPRTYRDRIARRDRGTAVAADEMDAEHAYANVAHYKNAFDKAGLRPDDLKIAR